VERSLLQAPTPAHVEPTSNKEDKDGQ
jgi:hypothetical protein